MRKVLLLSVVLISVVLLAAVLSGCGSNGAPPTPTPTPTPTYVYVTLPDFQSAGDGQIAAFKLNSDGTLTPVPGSPFSHAGAFVLTTLGASGLAVASSPTLCCIQPTISTWAIDATTGALSQHSADTNMPPVIAIAADLAGQFVYAAAGRDGTFGFANNAGTLSAVPGSPFNVVDDPVLGKLLESVAVAVTPSGKTLLMGLRTVQGHPPGVTLDAVHKGSDGSLVGAGANALVVEFGTNDFIVHPNNQNNQIVYAGTAPVDAFQLDETVPTIAESAAVRDSLISALGNSGDFIGGMAMDSAGKFLLLGDNYSQSVFVMSILSDGTVQAVPGSPFSTGLSQANLLPRVDPPDRFVVLLHSGPSPGIMVFTLDPASGGLALKGDTSLPRPARDLVLVHP